jgi:hypothetical protein
MYISRDLHLTKYIIFNSSMQSTELMHSEQTVTPASWNFMNGQLTPTSSPTYCCESSLSQFDSSTPHYNILLPWDGETNYDEIHLIYQASYYTFSKPLTPSHTPSPDLFYNSNSHIAALMAMQRQQQASVNDESMPTSDYGHSGRTSVASTRESPVTPPVAGEFEGQSGKIGEPTSVFMGEWSGKYLPVSHPKSAVFSQLLQAANNQHLDAPPMSPLGDQARDQKNAFREGSTLAPVSNIQQQMQRTSPVQPAPKTISPRDALLDYHETEEESPMPLFPQKSPQYHLQTNTAQEHGQSGMDDSASQQSFGSMATESPSVYPTSHAIQHPGTGFTFVPPSVPGGIRVPQQFNEYKPDNSDMKKPSGSTADGGAYTCTYHGCTLRFETPGKLQKHKRKGQHRPASSAGGSASPTAASQAGPHRCSKINPSTNKNCNTVFSRPYDLTRHEDTVHNPQREKVQCPLCKVGKGYSRVDALNKHLRVAHP